MDMTESDNYIGIVNNNTDDNSCVLEKEHMFDKVVTPSDVGKLNRLVIPKQHAERYFPLDDDNKSLLLNFEDHSGKSWRFRYSYWTSSQSYVMTKGWSRFVKDKKLDAGYIVSFQRGVGEVGRGRLFIDARRRPDPTSCRRNFPFVNPPSSLSQRWGRLYSSFPETMSFLRPLQSHPLINYGFNHQQPELIGTAASYYGHNVYLKSAAEEEAQSTATAIDPSPAAARTLRLFGVNMECSSSSSTHLGDQRPESSDQKGKASTSLDLDL